MYIGQPLPLSGPVKKGAECSARAECQSCMPFSSLARQFLHAIPVSDHSQTQWLRSGGSTQWRFHAVAVHPQPTIDSDPTIRPIAPGWSVAPCGSNREPKDTHATND